MKKLSLILLVLSVIALLFAGCDGDSAFVIKVSGTIGLEFSGSYLVVTASGQSTSKSVDGIVPTEYSVTGNIVSGVFQKQTEEGNLKVEIIKGGQVIASSETTAAYGVVSVATD